MKQIFRKNYKILTILLILILAAGCLMLPAFSSLSANEKVSVTTLNVAETNDEFAEEEINAAKAFLKAVEKLPNANNLNYGDRSLIADAKKKFDSLSEKAKLYEGVSEAEETYIIVREEFNSKFMIIEGLVTLGKGLLGIFLVMGIIIGIIYLLSYIGKRKEKVGLPLNN